MKADLLDPEVVLKWVAEGLEEELLSTSSAKDYLCKVRDRATYLQVWIPGPAALHALARAQARIKLVARQDPKEATPMHEKCARDPPASLALRTRFLTATGLRDFGARENIAKGRRTKGGLSSR